MRIRTRFWERKDWQGHVEGIIFINLIIIIGIGLYLLAIERYGVGVLVLVLSVPDIIISASYKKWSKMKDGNVERD